MLLLLAILEIHVWEDGGIKVEKHRIPAGMTIEAPNKKRNVDEAFPISAGRRKLARRTTGHWPGFPDKIRRLQIEPDGSGQFCRIIDGGIMASAHEHNFALNMVLRKLVLAWMEISYDD